MAIHAHGESIAEDGRLDFNGIDAATGSYLFEPMSTAELAGAARARALFPEHGVKVHLAELQDRRARKGQLHLGLKEGLDPTRLEHAGWGVVFPGVPAGSEAEQQQEAIREALSPLLALRRSQAARLKEHRYREYKGALACHPGESKPRYLARLGAGPGPADPDKVPYYLLLVGSPEAIPYSLQYQLDVQYAVGRIHFDTVEEYAGYARSVVAAETSGLTLPREVAFVGVKNRLDRVTQLCHTHLVGPLADRIEADVPGWKVSRHFEDAARKANVTRLVGGPGAPALLFTGSHGVGFPKGDPRQIRHQGALLLQDWEGPGSGRLTEDLYLSADDVPGDADLTGRIAFTFACYSGGTPEHDQFSKHSATGRRAIADHAFVAGLHRKLLGLPRGGALAGIGHVDRAWTYSFLTGAGGVERAGHIAVFESTLRALMTGMPVGYAVEYFNARYAETAADLSSLIEALDFDPGAADDATLANLWTLSNDARGYAVVGDPAVRLPPGDPAAG
jgi:hypothetical protein